MPQHSERLVMVEKQTTTANRCESQERHQRSAQELHRKEQVLGQMLSRVFVKRHSIVKSCNKHTSCGLSLFIGRGIDMEKAPKPLGRRLSAPYMKFL
jgi:hypothetical protein